MNNIIWVLVYNNREAFEDNREHVIGIYNHFNSAVVAAQNKAKIFSKREFHLGAEYSVHEVELNVAGLFSPVYNEENMVYHCYASDYRKGDV